MEKQLRRQKRTRVHSPQTSPLCYDPSSGKDQEEDDLKLHTVTFKTEAERQFQIIKKSLNVSFVGKRTEFRGRFKTTGGVITTVTAALSMFGCSCC